MVVSDVMKYKSKIMAELISVPDIYTLINNKDISKGSDMVNKNIFSYMKIPDTTTIVKNYICFDYNSVKSSVNDSFKNITINIGVICHESEIITPWGNRFDVLAGVLTESINWSNLLGFEVKLVSDKENIFENDYHGRTLQFKNVTFNSLKDGIKINGSR